LAQSFSHSQENGPSSFQRGLTPDDQPAHAVGNVEALLLKAILGGDPQPLKDPLLAPDFEGSARVLQRPDLLPIASLHSRPEGGIAGGAGADFFEKRQGLRMGLLDGQNRFQALQSLLGVLLLQSEKSPRKPKEQKLVRAFSHPCADSLVLGLEHLMELIEGIRFFVRGLEGA